MQEPVACLFRKQASVSEVQESLCQEGKAMILIGDYHLSLAALLLGLANFLLLVVIIILLKRGPKS